jgi:hypothetical protein
MPNSLLFLLLITKIRAPQFILFSLADASKKWCLATIGIGVGV